MAYPSLVDHPTTHPGHSFDAVAARYDASFTEQDLGRWLRQPVWETLSTAFHPGDVVIDLGCGTGEDSVWLARRGVNVLAIDASATMLEVAEAKARAAGVDDQVVFAQVDISTIGADGPRLTDLLRRANLPDQFNGAVSNFGPVNCVEERRSLSAALGQLICPGGTLILVVMGPLCPWEVGWYLAHGHVRTAVRRFRSGAPAFVGNGALPVWYPSPRRLQAEFTREFHHLQTRGLGVLLPPSGLGHLVQRAPRFFGLLRWIDVRISHTGPGTWLNDHYLSVFRRR